MASRVDVECLDCGHRTPFHPTPQACPRCGSAWREARYDLTALPPDLAQTIARRPPTLWRYLDLLPVRALPPGFSMGEGGTPLYPAHNLGMMLGLPHIYVKDERQSPTGSFKDRQAAVTVAALKEAGITEAVVASTGNVAISYSAYCARSGIRLWAFLTSLVPPEKMHEVAVYGTQVVKVTGTYDQAKQLAAEFAQRRGLYLDRGTRSVAAVEAMKTVAFEIAEQLGDISGSLPPPGPRPAAWRAPDWYIQAVSGGIGPVGVLKGFQELVDIGLVQQLPRLAGIQTAGCDPMAQAWREGRMQATPVTSPRTLIATLSTGDPGRSYTILRQRMLAGAGGTFDSVSDEEAFRAIHIVAKMEGISLEPAAAVAFAGLFKLAQAGRVTPDQVVVVNCSGHTMPVEEQLLGEGWAQDVALASPGLRQTPEEGLLAALAQIDPSRTRRILVVDDHADARRLITRILNAHGDYVVREAGSGAEALADTHRTVPDLVVLDLMMPEMDGFELLERLKAQPHTAHVPVVVVTAKTLTPEEWKRLEGHITRLMTKGDLLSEDLLSEISRALG